MKTKHLLPHTGEVVAHLAFGDTEPASRDGDAHQAVVVGAVPLLGEHFDALGHDRLVAPRAGAVALSLVTEEDRTRSCGLEQVRDAMAGGDHHVRSDQRHRARRQVGPVYVHDHADTRRDVAPNVTDRDTAHVVPLRWFAAVPERVVLRLGVRLIAQEGITVGERRRVLDARMALPSAVLVDLGLRGTSGCDQPDRHPTRKRVDIDRPSPEIRTVRGGEDVLSITEVNLHRARARQIYSGEVQDEQLGTTLHRRGRR